VNMFQSTPFARRETSISKCRTNYRCCFNPLPSQEGRPVPDRKQSGMPGSFQSTPFARRETPKLILSHRFSTACFNPLPSQEGRPMDCISTLGSRRFQSTPFARRETTIPTGYQAERWEVSIHSLRKKGDRLIPQKLLPARMFQSTPFARRETVNGSEKLQRLSCFNPLPSQEGRPYQEHQHPLLILSFQSTPFARRETSFTGRKIRIGTVSIHSLRKKGDRNSSRQTADH